MPKKIEWSTGTRLIKDLTPAEYNPRQLTEKQAKDLEKSLNKFNLADPIVINRDNKIIGGHQRINILKKQGITEVDVRIPNRKLTGKEEKELNLRLNKNLGEWDTDLLSNFDTDLLLDVGFTPEEMDSMFQLNVEPNEKDDEVPEQRETDIKLGDMFILGEHRLLCGDATKKADIEKLMQGEKADMVFTDPPYGMNLNTDWSSAKSSLRFAKEKNALGGKKHRKVIGDNEDFKPELITTIFDSFDYCDEIFAWGADYYSEYLKNKNNGSWIVWDKRLDESADKMYGSTFELCWSKKRHKRMIARVKWAGIFGTEKEFDHKRHHPTQKPILLVEWFFDYYSLKDKKIVADIFGGSGSTLIACEKTNRKCRIMELDPIYCQVIIDRWEEYTNSKVVKING